MNYLQQESNFLKQFKDVFGRVSNKDNFLLMYKSFKEKSDISNSNFVFFELTFIDLVLFLNTIILASAIIIFSQWIFLSIKNRFSNEIKSMIRVISNSISIFIFINGFIHIIITLFQEKTFSREFFIATFKYTALIVSIVSIATFIYTIILSNPKYVTILFSLILAVILCLGFLFVLKKFDYHFSFESSILLFFSLFLIIVMENIKIFYFFNDTVFLKKLQSNYLIITIFIFLTVFFEYFTVYSIQDLYLPRCLSHMSNDSIDIIKTGLSGKLSYYLFLFVMGNWITSIISGISYSFITAILTTDYLYDKRNVKSSIFISLSNFPANVRKAFVIQFFDVSVVILDLLICYIFKKLSSEIIIYQSIGSFLMMLRLIFYILVFIKHCSNSIKFAELTCTNIWQKLCRRRSIDTELAIFTHKIFQIPFICYLFEGLRNLYLLPGFFISKFPFSYLPSLLKIIENRMPSQYFKYILILHVIILILKQILVVWVSLVYVCKVFKKEEEINNLKVNDEVSQKKEICLLS